MVSGRKLVLAAGGLLVAGCPPGPDESTDTGGVPGTATEDGREAATGTGGTVRSEPLAVPTGAFEDGGAIPERYTGVGADVSPPLSIESVPSSAEALALVMDDPDANDYLHWLIWNVPAGRTEIPEGVPETETVDSLGGARQGTNDFGEVEYRGPLPPADDGPHTCWFTTYAVDTTLETEAGAGRSALASALEGRVLDRHRFTGEFER